MSSPPGPCAASQLFAVLLSFSPVFELMTRGGARSADLSLGGASEAAKSAFRDKKAREDITGFLPDGKCSQVGGLRGVYHHCASAIALVVGRAFARPVGQAALPAPCLLLQAALMQGDGYDANDAVRYRLALQPQPLQLLPRCGVDLGPPVTVRQAPSGRGLEHAREQGAALLGDLGIRHRLNERKSSRPSAPPACCPDPAKCTS
jgi:hypothetical protein